MNIVPAHGERALIVGRSGSGKSLFARWLLQHMPGAIIYDTKGDDAFDSVGPIVSTMDAAWDALADESRPEDFVVLRPEPDILADPMELDQLLLDHYDNGHGVTAYIDEGYQFHRNGRPGPGYLALLTRGRSRDISTITSTQRPAWLSMFALTEANHFYLLRLEHEDDMRRVGQVVGGYERRPRVPWHHWDYANAKSERIIRFAPIDIDYHLPKRYADVEFNQESPPASSEYFRWL